MLTSFLWHVLLLPWAYKWFESLRWDYGCYVLSRWSLLTSLTIFLWIIQWISLIWEAYGSYNIDFTISEESIKIDKKNSFFNIKDLSKFIWVLFILIISIIEYFSKVFQNYSKIILGLLKINFLEIPFTFYIYFSFTLILSIFLMKPRIYIIWIILFIWNVLEILSIIYNDWNRFQLRYLEGWISLFRYLVWILRGFLFEKRRINRFISGSTYDYKGIDLWTDEWKLIYPEGLVKDYLLYTRNDFDMEYLGIFEVLYIFEYRVDRYNQLILRRFVRFVFITGSNDLQYSLPIQFYLHNLQSSYSDLDTEDLIKEYWVNELSEEDNWDFTKKGAASKWRKNIMHELSLEEWKEKGFFYLFKDEKIFMD